MAPFAALQPTRPLCGHEPTTLEDGAPTRGVVDEQRRLAGDELHSPFLVLVAVRDDVEAVVDLRTTSPSMRLEWDADTDAAVRR